jgi:RNA polymerase sigma-70 factor, ECF subfamily
VNPGRPAAHASVVPMSVPARPHADEVTLLGLARAGDDGAFGDLVKGYRAELRSHCYRMLGSVHDADDALQDALLRAWRNLPGFEGRSSLRAWLYAIATNSALDITRRRSRRELPVSFGPAGAAGADLAAGLPDAVWLEPFPDQWLAGDPPSSPEARYDQRESVELAFIVALQHLPPLQRAVLILRDVLAFSAAEVSGQLGTSVAAVNSALQRARAAVQRGLPARSQQETLRDLGDQRVREIAQRYADAIERGDANELISMLTKDATWSMPPIPTWFQGHNAIREFTLSGPLRERWMHRPAYASGQLAIGCYLPARASSGYVPAVIDVLTLAGDKIAAVTGFLTPYVENRAQAAVATGEEIFARFGLPAELP